MGFNSTHRLPYLTTHAGAKKWHDQIKPLRGSEPELRPLAARRDKHMQIRENAQGDIECILYETPVVIFKQDDSVVVTPGKWVSSYTSAFLEGLLPGVSSSRTRGMLVLHLNRIGEKYPLRKDMTLTMRRIKDEPGYTGRWEVQQAEGVGAWAPNRTKANSVRSKYKEMLGYHKGAVLMLTQQREKNNEDDPFEAGKIVVLQKQMLADSLGVRESTEREYQGKGFAVEVTSTYVDTQMFRRAMHKPTWTCGHGWNNADERIANWTELRNEVLALMRSDQPEDTKYANFTKASMGLLAMAGGADRVELRVSGPVRPGYRNSDSLEVSYSAALSAVNDFLMLAYAEEIMELKQMPVGRVPTTSYAGMLFSDFRKQGEMK